MLFYIALFFLYHYLIYRYLNESLDRQLLGFHDTLAVTAVIAAYIALCAVPPFFWSRKSRYHPIWRAIECFACYVAVNMLLGAIYAASMESDWSTWSGVAVGGDAWMRIASVLALSVAFIAASWWGGKTGAAKGRGRSSSGRKSKASTS